MLCVPPMLSIATLDLGATSNRPIVKIGPQLPTHAECETSAVAQGELRGGAITKQLDAYEAEPEAPSNRE
jgi:hypothetical protein